MIFDYDEVLDRKQWDIPKDASPNFGLGMQVNIRDKLRRCVKFNNSEASEFGGICEIGPFQLFDCYHDLDEWVTPQNMTERCSGCAYFKPSKHIPEYAPEYSYLGIGNKIRYPEFVEEHLKKMCVFGEAKAFVYFISDGEFVKIGKAKDIEKRLNGIKTGNPRPLRVIARIPFKTERDAHEAEQELHRVYRSFRVCAEWYDILHYILVDRFAEEFNGDMKGENK